jgi:hypothetical protein
MFFTPRHALFSSQPLSEPCICEFQQKLVYHNLLLYVVEVHPVNSGTSFIGTNKAVSKHEKSAGHTLSYSA